MTPHEEGPLDPRAPCLRRVRRDFQPTPPRQHGKLRVQCSSLQRCPDVLGTRTNTRIFAFSSYVSLHRQGTSARCNADRRTQPRCPRVPPCTKCIWRAARNSTSLSCGSASCAIPLVSSSVSAFSSKWRRSTSLDHSKVRFPRTRTTVTRTTVRSHRPSLWSIPP